MARIETLPLEFGLERAPFFGGRGFLNFTHASDDRPPLFDQVTRLHFVILLSGRDHGPGAE
jgi:hypothetical protein